MEQGLVFAFFLNSMRRSNEGRFDAPMADILVNRARLIHPEMPLMDAIRQQHRIEDQHQ